MTDKKKLSVQQNHKQTLIKDKKQLNVVNKCRNIQDMFRARTSTVDSKYLLYNINYTYNLQYTLLIRALNFALQSSEHAKINSLKYVKVKP